MLPLSFSRQNVKIGKTYEHAQNKRRASAFWHQRSGVAVRSPDQRRNTSNDAVGAQQGRSASVVVVCVACTALCVVPLRCYGAYTARLRSLYGVKISQSCHDDLAEMPDRFHGVACDRTALTSAFYSLE